MNPNSPAPNFELPAPVAPEGASIEAGPKPAAPEGYTQPSQPVAAQPAPAAVSPITPVSQPVPLPAVDPAKAVSPGTPLTADDADLIEKEWIVKAKQIIAATKDDPYIQNKELSKFKADYLKKRYNKEIKVDD